MSQAVGRKSNVEKAADIIRDAGGSVIGRTRLQKTAYLLELAGLGSGFTFEYRYYGPYSEGLATAVRNAALLGLLEEDESPATWGGYYSIFTVEQASNRDTPRPRKELAQMAATADPVQLELAATAAFLFLEGNTDPWLETKKRKPEKATGGRLEKAKSLYSKLRQIQTPVSLPPI
jgi:uncharacterized protein